MIECQVYDASFQNRWNDFVAASRNGTFLFDRRFMDYHADRFTDHSLLFFRGRRLLAVMPASQHGYELRSHGGLTYGGLVTSPRATMTDVIEMFEVLLSHMRDSGYKTLVYKKIPYVYARVPADEDLYAISRIENEKTAHVTQCRQVSSAIDRDCRVRFSIYVAVASVGLPQPGLRLSSHATSPRFGMCLQQRSLPVMESVQCIVLMK